MELDYSAHRLATGLARVAVAVQLAGDAAEPGLERTIAQQQVLLLLSQRREVYPLTDLSSHLGMTPAATLAALTTLQREGMVSMGPSPSYAPQDVRVALTERGRSQSPELLNWAAQLLAQLHNLDPAAQRQLLAVVTDQIRRLQRQGRIPVTKMCLSCRFFDGYAHSSLTEPHHCWLVDGAFGHLQLRLRCPDASPGDDSLPGVDGQPGGDGQPGDDGRSTRDVDPAGDPHRADRPVAEVDPHGER